MFSTTAKHVIRDGRVDNMYLVLTLNALMIFCSFYDYDYVENTDK